MRGAFQDLLKSYVSFGGVLEDSNEQKWEDNKRKSFYSEMWGNAVGVLMGQELVKIQKLLKYIWVNI